MRYFYKLADGIVVLPIMSAVMRNATLWNVDKTRTSFEGSPHKQASDILLRCCKTDSKTLSEAYVDLEAFDRPAFALIGPAREMALDVMKIVGGTRLGRVVLTKLPPGGKIEPHADEGAYADYYTRYHVVLHGLPGSMFMCGDESTQMKTGELWWFDHAAQHSVKNNSVDDRIHLIVDIRIDK